MLKLNRIYNTYRLVNFCETCVCGIRNFKNDHNKLQQNRPYERKRKNFNYACPRALTKITFTLGLGIAMVYCDRRRPDKDEKRLFKACMFGLTHEVERLIKEGANVNKRHQLGWTPLLVAAVNERNDIVEILLNAGADPNISDNYINANRTAHEKGMHPIEVLMIRDEEFSGTLNNKATFLGFTALHYAVLTDNFEMVKLLLNHGADPTTENDIGHTPVIYAKDVEIRHFLERELAISFDQFEREGCDNCDEFLRMKEKQDNVYDCTSRNFDGMISVMCPEDSWVSKWQRINRFCRGVYAISVSGRLPNNIVRELQSRGIVYKSRDNSQR